MLGFSELLVDGLYGTLPDKATEALDRIQKDGRHLLGLINDVLDISKIEAGQLSLSLSEYSIYPSWTASLHRPAHLLTQRALRSEQLCRRSFPWGMAMSGV